ncbi:MAG: (2Fe-2S)-binding protein [Methylotenera sp.]|nr:(2Fe-2S)-binding protein [Methylotenera sp.]
MSLKIDNLDDDVMCTCSGTTRGQILKFFKAGLDIDTISRKTGALSGCAGCEWDIEQYLKELAGQLIE